MPSMTDSGLLAILAAQNPDVFAQYAAEQGIAPPGAESLSLDAIVNSTGGQSPFAGVKAPPGPPAPMQPATPAAPQPNGQIQPAASVLELLLKGNQPAIQPNLGAILAGR